MQIILAHSKRCHSSIVENRSVAAVVTPLIRIIPQNHSHYLKGHPACCNESQKKMKFTTQIWYLKPRENISAFLYLESQFSCILISRCLFCFGFARSPLSQRVFIADWKFFMLLVVARVGCRGIIQKSTKQLWKY